MLSRTVLEQLEKKWGEAVMVRAEMENVFSTELVERLFDRHRGRQYRRDLLFYTLVGLMGLVVCRVRPSLHKAYTEAGQSIAVSVKSVVDELHVRRSRALVTHRRRCWLSALRLRLTMR